MLIFSMKPDHDGGVAVVDAEKQELVLSYEAEKDSFPRYSPFDPTTFLEAAGNIDRVPEIFAVSGWCKASPTPNNLIGAGYNGVSVNDQIVQKKTIFGVERTFFSSTHALSHIWCSYALSPFTQGQPCYALVWEGALGDFFEIDADLRVKHIGNVMKAPGNKFGFLYSLADPTFDLRRGQMRFGDPGKLMALCSYGDPGKPTVEEQSIIDLLLQHESILSFSKEDLKSSPFYNSGVQSKAFTQLAKRLSDELFSQFEKFARKNLKKGYPLLISGGCGLNCDWNSGWKDSGIFEDIFIPPCTNDTGSAIGTAVDAMRHFTGNAKLSWDVYRGLDFFDDHPEMLDVVKKNLVIQEVAEYLNAGNVVAWAKGRCEIGPRALGNRSLLAAPFEASMHTRLNEIKGREEFRPIAPICIEEDVGKHFSWYGPSPYMLFFQEVTDTNLKAVTHVDNTARVQTVRKDQNDDIYNLLLKFRNISGSGVLCNTSLNFNGTGFINRTSDLYYYCKTNGIDAFVYGDYFCKFQ